MREAADKAFMATKPTKSTKVFSEKLLSATENTESTDDINVVEVWRPH